MQEKQEEINGSKKRGRTDSNIPAPDQMHSLNPEKKLRKQDASSEEEGELLE
jgi:hypothetical protein